MAGIGKYKKGKAFKLRSGNAPAFKMMAGESPITRSPYKEVEVNKDGVEEEDSGAKKGNGWKKALKIGVGALTGGLDAVYGSGKILSGSERLKKDNKKKECKDDDGNVVECPQE